MQARYHYEAIVLVRWSNTNFGLNLEICSADIFADYFSWNLYFWNPLDATFASYQFPDLLVERLFGDNAIAYD